MRTILNTLIFALIAQSGTLWAQDVNQPLPTIIIRPSGCMGVPCGPQPIQPRPPPNPGDNWNDPTTDYTPASHQPKRNEKC